MVANLQTGDEVYAAAEAMVERLRKFPGLRLQVQRQARCHREVLLGMTRDARYGPLFALGHLTGLLRQQEQADQAAGHGPGQEFSQQASFVRIASRTAEP